MATHLDLDTVARMAKIGGCWSPTFSPDGETIAFVSNLSGTPQLWKVPASGGWPERITALDDPISSAAWSPDGAWLAFGMAPGGGMNGQIYVIRPDGGDLRRLSAGGRDNNWLGRWTADGAAISVASSRDAAERMDAFLAEAESGTMHLVATNPGIGALTDVSADGRWALLYRMVNRSSSDLYLVNRATGAETLLTPHDGPGNFDNARFGTGSTADQLVVYLLGDLGRERVALARIRIAVATDGQAEAGPFEVLVGRDDADLQEFEISPDGTLAALLWNQAGRNVLNFYDLQAGTLTAGPELPGEIAYSLHFSPDGRRLTFTLTGAALPRDIWVLEGPGQAASRMWQVTHSAHAGVRLETLVRPELVEFTAHDGLPLSGWLYRPSGVGAPGAAVLSFHGGPEAQERPTFNATYQALLAAGIAVLAPNVRGSSGFGKTFVNLDNGALRVNAVRDIEACADYLIVAGIAEAGRIGIMGGSYGGYMTMAGLTEFPDRFAAGANLFGIVNFKTFFAHTEPWMAAISKVEYGDPETQGEMLDSLSPIFRLDRIRAATLVLHGANDTNVPVVEAQQVVDGLKARGVPVEYVLFPDEGHGFQKEPNRIRATGAIVRWFARHLLGVEVESEPAQPEPSAAGASAITPAVIATAERLIGLTFTPDERDLMLDNLRGHLDDYAKLRAVPLPNEAAPAIQFNPQITPLPPARSKDESTVITKPSFERPQTVPDDLEALAFWPVTRLAALIATRKVTSVALTEMYLRRLKRYGPTLNCVVTLLEDRALEQARRADAELAAGNYRGPLHGIPWGAKDLLAVRGAPTTWGAEPYVDQQLDLDATVVSRLDAAGAVLVAKLSVGALAWGDVWFGGLTRNPWNPEEGSSGSSAGSASATAAGLVGFSIGTETYGSIVSPSTRCRVTGLRPSFGRVSRHGAMALSWTMDKIGPICRSVEDCALVFAAIQGPDGFDPTVVDVPFAWKPLVEGLNSVRVGYLSDLTPEGDPCGGLYAEALDTLRRLGVTLVPVKLPDLPVEALTIILEAEAAAAFDELTRSDRDSLLARQVRDAWPNVFRQARLIPAVEYIQANRIRRLLMQAMHEMMAPVDVFVAPSFAAMHLLMTNLTGHPAVVIPHGLGTDGQPCSLTFTGPLYGDNAALALAQVYQAATRYHLEAPML